MTLFPIPGYPDYTADVQGRIYNNGILRKKTYKNKKQGRAKLNIQVNGTKHTKTVARLVLSAKLGRQLESWEHACHMNGDPVDDRMENLEIGCIVNNAIDEVCLGRATTSASQIHKAIERLQTLLIEKHGYE